MKATTIVSIMILSSAALFLVGGGNGEIPGTRAGEGTRPFCYFYSNELGTHYIGDTVNFYIRVENEYTGWLWKDENYHSSYDDLFNCKLSVDHTRITNDDDVLSPVIQPVEVGSLTPYNPPDGYSSFYTIQYYSTDTGDAFRLKISTTGVKEDYYRLPVSLDFYVRTGYDESNPGEFYQSHQSQKGYLQLNVKSHIYSLSADPLSMWTTESGSTVPTYSGARSLSVQMNNIRAQTGRTLSNLKATLDFGQSPITVLNPDLNYPSLTSTYKTLRWRIDVEPQARPDDYIGYLTFQYRYSDVPIIDGPYNTVLRIKDTPLIQPVTMIEDRPVLAIVQKSRACTLSIEMQNVGNVDLETATVRLDLDSANYFEQEEYRIDEDDQGVPVYRNLEVTVEDISPGQHFLVFFPDIRVEEMIPPGDYMIPLDYQLVYTDPYEDSGVPDYLYSYQWDELGGKDFTNLMLYRTFPRPLSVPKPYVIVRVMDDPLGADLEVRSETVFDSGEKGVPLEIDLMNHELYDLDLLSLQIFSLDSFLVSNHDTPSYADLLLDMGSMKIPRGEKGSPSITPLMMYVDVGETQTQRLVNYTLSFTYTNSSGLLLMRSLKFTSTIEPGKGDLTFLSYKIVGMEGSSILIEMEMVNSGKVDLTRSNLVFESDENYIKINNPYPSMGALEKGDDQKVLLNITIGNSAVRGSAYPLSFRSSFTDLNGYNVELFDRDPTIIMVQIPASRGNMSLISVETSAIHPGGHFYVNLSLMNTGDISLIFVDSLLSSNNNMITIQRPVIASDNIRPKKYLNLSYGCLASSEIDHEQDFSLMLHLSFQDEDGCIKDYGENEPIRLDLRTDNAPPEPEDTSMEDSIKNSAWYITIGLLAAVIIFSVTLIVLSIIMLNFLSKRERPTSEGKGPKTKDGTMPPAMPKPMEIQSIAPQPVLPQIPQVQMPNAFPSANEQLLNSSHPISPPQQQYMPAQQQPFEMGSSRDLDDLFRS